MPAMDPSVMVSDPFMTGGIGFRLLSDGQLALLAPAEPIQNQSVRQIYSQRLLK